VRGRCEGEVRGIFGSGDCPARPDPETRLLALTTLLVNPFCKTQSPLELPRRWRLSAENGLNQ
jgi:hypothetical protein